jgi:hypothetical protein
VIAERFVGQRNFQTLSTKAYVLSKMGKNEQADQLMAEALPMGNVTDLHQYARSLLNNKKQAGT